MCNHLSFPAVTTLSCSLFTKIIYVTCSLLQNEVKMLCVLSPFRRGIEVSRTRTPGVIRVHYGHSHLSVSLNLLCCLVKFGAIIGSSIPTFSEILTVHIYIINCVDFNVYVNMLVYVALCVCMCTYA